MYFFDSDFVLYLTCSPSHHFLNIIPSDVAVLFACSLYFSRKNSMCCDIGEGGAHANNKIIYLYKYSMKSNNFCTTTLHSHHTLNIALSLLVLCLLGRFKCLTSPFLSLLSLFFQLPISFHHHPVQHHLSWSSSGSFSYHFPFHYPF